jgi:hypothetical protein
MSRFTAKCQECGTQLEIEAPNYEEGIAQAKELGWGFGSTMPVVGIAKTPVEELDLFSHRRQFAEVGEVFCPPHASQKVAQAAREEKERRELAEARDRLRREELRVEIYEMLEHLDSVVSEAYLHGYLSYSEWHDIHDRLEVLARTASGASR